MEKLEKLIEQINLLEGNRKFASYNKFVVNMKDDGHVLRRLKERSQVDEREFREVYVPKICDAIEIAGGLKQGKYALVCDKFIVMALFTPYKYSNKSHDLFLTTVLESDMRIGKVSYKLIVEHLASEFNLELKTGEYCLETDEIFENYYVFTSEDKGLQLETAKSFYILDIAGCKHLCIYCGQDPCVCK